VYGQSVGWSKSRLKWKWRVESEASTVALIYGIMTVIEASRRGIKGRRVDKEGDGLVIWRCPYIHVYLYVGTYNLYI